MMGLLARARKYFKETFSLDLKDDMGVYYYNFILTYTFVVITCIVMCDSVPTQNAETSQSTYTLEVIQTILDTIIPSTIAFACSIFLQNLATTSRIGATKYPWNLALIFVAFLYWGEYLRSREIETAIKGFMFIFASLFIVFLCTASTIQTYNLQRASENNPQTASLSAE